MVKGKKAADLPSIAKQNNSASGNESTHSSSFPYPHLIQAKKKNFGIGGDVLHKRDLTKYVKWPKYITLQRKKRVLMTRLKVPPMINQFSQTLDKNQAKRIVHLLKKYSPETRQEKTARLEKMAQAKQNGTEFVTTKPINIKFGLNHVTSLIENKKAKFVLIAHDVEPIEMVLWMPTLCRKMGIPYAIIKSKSTLGKLVHKKTASCVAMTECAKEDSAEFESIQSMFMESFNNNVDIRRRWGGGIMGKKTQHTFAKRQKAIEQETAKKLAMRA